MQNNECGWAEEIIIFFFSLLHLHLLLLLLLWTRRFGARTRGYLKNSKRLGENIRSVKCEMHKGRKGGVEPIDRSMAVSVSVDDVAAVVVVAHGDVTLSYSS